MQIVNTLIASHKFHIDRHQRSATPCMKAASRKYAGKKIITPTYASAPQEYMHHLISVQTLTSLVADEVQSRVRTTPQGSGATSTKQASARSTHPNLQDSGTPPIFSLHCRLQCSRLYLGAIRCLALNLCLARPKHTIHSHLLARRPRPGLHATTHGEPVGIAMLEAPNIELSMRGYGGLTSPVGSGPGKYKPLRLVSRLWEARQKSGGSRRLAVPT